MRLTIGMKATRVLMFLMGVRNRKIARALRRYGFTDGNLEEGWSLLKGLSRGRLDVAAALDPRLVRELDRFENHWFPIVKAVLQRNFPEVHDVVFRNLTQTEGSEVIVSVGTLLDRIEQIAKPESDGGMGKKGKDACKLLSERGFNDAEIASARALLAEAASFESDDEVEDPVGPDEAEAAETALWAWYLEWSAIARVAIKDRSMLRAMGFLRTTASGTDEEVVDPADPTDPAPAPSPVPSPEPTT